MASLRLRGLGGRGGNGLFILAGDGEGWSELRSDGGAFSLADFCLRNVFDFDELGFGDVDDDDGESFVWVSLKTVLLGSMKCFIVQKFREIKEVVLEKEYVLIGQDSETEGGLGTKKKEEVEMSEKCSR